MARANAVKDWRRRNGVDGSFKVPLKTKTRLCEAKAGFLRTSQLLNCEGAALAGLLQSVVARGTVIIKTQGNSRSSSFGRREREGGCVAIGRIDIGARFPDAAKARRIVRSIG